MKNCATCDQPYEPRSNNSKYCSKRCKALRHGFKTCEGCGKQFVPTAGSAGRFCCRECWYVAPIHKLLVPRECPVCGVVFQPKADPQKTCGFDCGVKFRKRKPRPANCAHCGKPLDPYRRPGQKFCDKRCARFGIERSHPGCLPVGSRRILPLGYAQIKTDDGWKLEHRLVIERSIGRPLEKHERVHHKNGTRDDNRLENLELWKLKRKDPSGVRADDYHCPGCRCFDH